MTRLADIPNIEPRGDHKIVVDRSAATRDESVLAIDLIANMRIGLVASSRALNESLIGILTEEPTFVNETYQFTPQSATGNQKVVIAVKQGSWSAIDRFQYKVGAGNTANLTKRDPIKWGGVIWDIYTSGAFAFATSQTISIMFPELGDDMEMLKRLMLGIVLDTTSLGGRTLSADRNAATTIASTAILTRGDWYELSVGTGSIIVSGTNILKLPDAASGATMSDSNSLSFPYEFGNARNLRVGHTSNDVVLIQLDAAGSYSAELKRITRKTSAAEGLTDRAVQTLITTLESTKEEAFRRALYDLFTFTSRQVRTGRTLDGTVNTQMTDGSLTRGETLALELSESGTTYDKLIFRTDTLFALAGGTTGTILKDNEAIVETLTLDGKPSDVDVKIGRTNGGELLLQTSEQHTFGAKLDALTPKPMITLAQVQALIDAHMSENSTEIHAFYSTNHALTTDEAIALIAPTNKATVGSPENLTAEDNAGDIVNVSDIIRISGYPDKAPGTSVSLYVAAIGAKIAITNELLWTEKSQSGLLTGKEQLVKLTNGERNGRTVELWRVEGAIVGATGVGEFYIEVRTADTQIGDAFNDVEVDGNNLTLTRENEGTKTVAIPPRPLTAGSISGAAADTDLSGGEEVPVAEGGSLKKTSTQSIADLARTNARLFATGQNYKIGELVVSNDILYRVKADITNSQSLPADDSTNYQALGSAPSSGGGGSPSGGGTTNRGALIGTWIGLGGSETISFDLADDAPTGFQASGTQMGLPVLRSSPTAIGIWFVWEDPDGNEQEEDGVTWGGYQTSATRRARFQSGSSWFDIEGSNSRFAAGVGTTYRLARTGTGFPTGTKVRAYVALSSGTGGGGGGDTSSITETPRRIAALPAIADSKKGEEVYLTTPSTNDVFSIDPAQLDGTFLGGAITGATRGYMRFNDRDFIGHITEQGLDNDILIITNNRLYVRDGTLQDLSAIEIDGTEYALTLTQWGQSFGTSDVRTPNLDYYTIAPNLPAGNWLNFKVKKSDNTYLTDGKAIAGVGIYRLREVWEATDENAKEGNTLNTQLIKSYERTVKGKTAKSLTFTAGVGSFNTHNPFDNIPLISYVSAANNYQVAISHAASGEWVAPSAIEVQGVELALILDSGLSTTTEAVYVSATATSSAQQISATQLTRLINIKYANGTYAGGASIETHDRVLDAADLRRIVSVVGRGTQFPPSPREGEEFSLTLRQTIAGYSVLIPEASGTAFIGFSAQIGSVDRTNANIGAILYYTGDSANNASLRNRLVVLRTGSAKTPQSISVDGTSYTLTAVSGLANHYASPVLNSVPLTDGVGVQVQITFSDDTKAYPDEVAEPATYLRHLLRWVAEKQGRTNDEIDARVKLFTGQTLPTDGFALDKLPIRVVNELPSTQAPNTIYIVI